MGRCAGESHHHGGLGPVAASHGAAGSHHGGAILSAGRVTVSQSSHHAECHGAGMSNHGDSSWDGLSMAASAVSLLAVDAG
jgi:hypothetical protein